MESHVFISNMYFEENFNEMCNTYMQEPPKGLGALYFRILQIMKQTMKVILNSNELGLTILICNVTTYCISMILTILISMFKITKLENNKRWYMLFYHLSNCILLE